jgi:crotonobetainyl-CoA:carnitine CoA-transferase CaiB-like acyl-CoA transferase
VSDPVAPRRTALHGTDTQERHAAERTDYHVGTDCGDSMTLPLQGVKVLDLTSVMAGPYCAMVLGDMGADVIKIESFPGGDTSRSFDPKVNGESYCFAVLNRNKRSLALDLKAPKGKEVVLKLAAQADIVLENFRPGVVDRLGLGPRQLCELNPALVYASMSGFGQTGPYAHKGGYDIIAQGMSGIMTMTGSPGGRPAKVGIAMNDIASGVTALYGILGAYIGRLRTGKGQYLETSLLEAGLAWTQWEIAAWAGAGEVPSATGTRHRRSAPYQAYRTSDGYVTVGAGNEKLWQNFCRMVVEKPEWLTDARYARPADRLAHADDLERDIEAVFTRQPTSHWVALLDAAQVPGGPVFTYDQVLADPHVAARKMVVEVEHPRIGMMKTLGLPIKSTGDLAEIRLPAPLLGQHSREVLRELGYGSGEIEALMATGVAYSDEA